MASTPGVLTRQAICAACGLRLEDEASALAESGVIRPARRGNVRTAGYDLRLGTDYYLRHESSKDAHLVARSLERGAGLVLPPNAVAVISAFETVSFDKDLIGHVSLKMDLLLQGLIMASQSQFDAGYEGGVFALLYNLSDSPVTIKQGESVLRLELERLAEEVDEPYSGDYRDQSLTSVLKVPLRSSLAQMSRQIEDVQREADDSRQELDDARRQLNREIETTDRTNRTRAIVGSIVATLLPLLILLVGGLFGDISGLKADVKALNAQISSSGPVKVVPRRTLNELCQELRHLESGQRVRELKACEPNQDGPIQ
jgi:deoxycytidine triphosphate deaminase